MIYPELNFENLNKLYIDQNMSIDKVAEKENRTRSELIREALRTYINKQNIVNKYMSNPIAEQNASKLEELL